MGKEQEYLLLIFEYAVHV